MSDLHTIQSVIVTNTIVAAFCIVLLITLTIFIIILVIPFIRRRWFDTNEKENNQIADLSSLSRQPSFHNLTLGSSRFNPIFEPVTGATTSTTTQFGTLFHPQATTATLLHPTIWTSMSPTSVISSPLAAQSVSTSNKTTVPPPVPSNPPMQTTSSTTTAAAAATQRSPRRIIKKETV